MEYLEMRYARFEIFLKEEGLEVQFLTPNHGDLFSISNGNRPCGWVSFSALLEDDSPDVWCVVCLIK